MSVHPMMAEPSHDERAQQLFIRDLRSQLMQMGAAQRGVVEHTIAALAAEKSAEPSEHELRTALMSNDVYRMWISLRRRSQEMLWEGVTGSVDRQLEELTAKARVTQPRGSLRLDPTITIPAYLANKDVHLMPGGYAQDRGDGDIRQGAIMDRGGAVYLLGRNGGLMNDGRGHALVSHVFDRAPDFAPQRTLELGCGVGVSTVACASYFPTAEHWGVDIGAALLRYAHARAEHLGVTVHFAQANAECTGFPDNHFDLVYSCATLHETSATGARAILREAHRLLRPGGLMAHLEVPSRYAAKDRWARLEGDFEQRYNNEPFWHGANMIDYRAVLDELKFRDIMLGYQATRPQAERGNKGFSEISSGVFACWFVMSAIK